MDMVQFRSPGVLRSGAGEYRAPPAGREGSLVPGVPAFQGSRSAGSDRSGFSFRRFRSFWVPVLGSDSQLLRQAVLGDRHATRIALMSNRISPELEILRSPRRAYSLLAAEPQQVSILGACYRPAVAALTLGTAVSISSTSHVSIGLVATVTACWAFLAGIQVIAAWVAIPPAPPRAIGRARAIDLLFSGHAPWSLWMLACAVWALTVPISARDSRWLLASVTVPMVWNVAIVYAFFRDALDLPHGVAVRRTIAHQAMAVGSTLALFGSAVAIWPRIVGMFVR
jgi:hypothetical protein